MGSLAVTYFRTREVHYHRRNFVSRSCSGWEGVGPKGYGRQAKRVFARCAAGRGVRKTGKKGGCGEWPGSLKVIGSSLTGN